MATRRQFLKATSTVAAGLALSGALAGGAQIGAAAPTGGMMAAASPTPGPRPPYLKQGRIKQADRRKAAANFRKARQASGVKPFAVPTPGGVPDYFGPYPNWHQSPILQKFVDTLPGIGPGAKTPASPGFGQNNLGQYLPLAVADTTTYAGSDYYEIALVQYRERLHTNLPAVTGTFTYNVATKTVTSTQAGGTLLRGYVQVNHPTDATVKDKPHYLGPLLLAQRGKPVRVKFINALPTGAGGDLFIPTDTTIMGSGVGPDGVNDYAQNRATLHLHGGETVWISDGTAHQWTSPANETTPWPKGVSVRDVPDMPAAGPGEMTFYYSNEQSARLMFYHDHALGITRLNVYVGEAAGYLLTDPEEQKLITGGTVGTTTIAPNTIPSLSNTIPLIIQDRSFVNAATIGATDPTWNWGSTPGTPVTGDLWWPHVFMPNQNPYDISGANAMGRYDYGPWFWPPFTAIQHPPVTNPYYDPALVGSPPLMPGTPNNSSTPESFMDTMMVNGTPYPKVTVDPKAYRLRILNACNDRFVNLQMYVAASGIVSGFTGLTGGAGYDDPPLVTIGLPGEPGKGASARAEIDTEPFLADGTTPNPKYRQVIALNVVTVGNGYTAVPTVVIDPPPGGTAATATATIYTLPTEVGMVPTVPPGPWPTGWGTPDGREGGWPDPATRGPAWLQIGTEGGLLPKPAVIKNIPIDYNYNRRDIVVLNVQEKCLFLGPAERADAIVDFTPYAGKTIILYSDAPAPVPASDPRIDYYTCDPDFSVATGDGTGGAASTKPGEGPNTRTIMQIVVTGTPAATVPLDYYNPATLTALNTALPAVFAASQPKIIVPQSVYNAAYGATFPDNYVRIQDFSTAFTPIGGAAPLTMQMRSKAIVEEWSLDYGRMISNLGVELPFTNNQVQTTIWFGYVDPVTEIVKNTANPASVVGSLGDGTQIWKITHNGVDTHAIHFHLFNVQLINRVGWDGAVRLPAANEVGWKDTVDMNPLEDCIVALRPVKPVAPWPLPNSVRLLNPAEPAGATFMNSLNVDPNNNPVTLTNVVVNYGAEYVWHCHLLGHEEHDMMRPMGFVTAPEDPTALTATTSGLQVTLTWTNNARNVTSWVIQRATNNTFTTSLTNLSSTTVVQAGQNTFVNTVPASGTYYYRVTGRNTVGGGITGFPSEFMDSAPVVSAPVVATAASGNLIFEDTFERTNGAVVPPWSGVTGQATLQTNAAMVGTWGMRARVVVGGAPTTAYLTDNSPTNETTYRARFYFNPHDATGADNANVVTIFRALNGTAGAPGVVDLIQVQFRRNTTVNPIRYEVRAGVRNSTNGFSYTNWFAINNNAVALTGRNWIEIAWTRNTATNAQFKLYVNRNVDNPSQTLTVNVPATTTYRVQTAQLGVIAGTGVAGNLYFDQFKSTRGTILIGP